MNTNNYKNFLAVVFLVSVCVLTFVGTFKAKEKSTETVTTGSHNIKVVKRNIPANTLFICGNSYMNDKVMHPEFIERGWQHYLMVCRSYLETTHNQEFNSEEAFKTVKSHDISIPSEKIDPCGDKK